MLNEVKELYRAGLLSPSGLYRLTGSFFHTGINPMALLRYAAKCSPGTPAITDEQETITYHELFRQCTQLSFTLQRQHKVGPRQKVAIICRNHAALVHALFSVSYLGAHVYLLNAEMSAPQLATLIQQHAFDLIIHDADVREHIVACGYRGRTLHTYHPSGPSVHSICDTPVRHLPRISGRARAGDIVVLSGGTTGGYKTAARRPGIVAFVQPFCSLLVHARLAHHGSVYIATPIYHGYGLAAMFISVLLGSHMFLTQRFHAPTACALIATHKIEVATLVPLMLHRMLGHDAHALHSLQCIISGGAPLHPALVRHTAATLGHKLFDLYGTSEAGICIMATPADLAHAPASIGRPVTGVQVRILDAQDRVVPLGMSGRICIRNAWSVTSAAGTWVETGDVGHMDTQGYIYLRGRVDDMIVSGGENVYPVTLEHVLLQHPHIREAAVIGVPDADFGQRLRAFIVVADGCGLTEDDLREWLARQVARYQLPRDIVFLQELPYTPLGKPDKRKLRQ
ncbi:AMP-binding protein [Nemorincola caseinilytica]|uniref:AMP-binding protein n=1 Tax=Nemorincola caseinilytica TaxID=2054315 RepID=A0ABP8NHU1_9BACT